MNTQQIYQELQVLFAKVFARDFQIHENLAARDVADWDSIRNIKLIVAIEKHFAIRFHLGELESSRVLKDWVALIQKHLAEHAK